MDRPGEDRLVRLGGLAILAAFAIHVVVNFVLKEFPPENASAAELRAYLSREAGTWSVVHGARYVAVACIALFVAGLFTRTRGEGRSPATGWGVVGLLGSSVLVTNLMVTNGIETLAFLDIELLSERQELFWLLFELTRVLFTAEIVAWGLVILGFSVAGSYSSTVPRWLSAAGVAIAVMAVLSGVFVVSVILDGWAGYLMTAAGLGGLAWFVCVGVLMAWRGASKNPAEDTA